MWRAQEESKCSYLGRSVSVHHQFDRWSGFGREVRADGAEVSRGHSTHRNSVLDLMRMPGFPLYKGWGRAERWELIF